MEAQDAGSDELLNLAAQGDAAAVERLLARHRDRLDKMVAVRMDPRLSPRADPSDVVQEALLEASRKLADYLQYRPLPFYPWLRQIAWEQLLHFHQRHIEAQKRSIRREQTADLTLPDRSAVQLANHLMATGSSPSRHMARRELHTRVRDALERMSLKDREVLVMWYLEQIPARDIAAVLSMTEAGVKSRHRRALERLQGILEGELPER